MLVATLRGVPLSRRGRLSQAIRRMGAYAEKRARRLGELSETVPELQEDARFRHRLARLEGVKPSWGTTLKDSDVELLLEAGLSTYALHVESRIASALGEGFYTIGPCGEEALGAVGLALYKNDPTALHYRHLATSIARMLAAGRDLDSIILDRARGYVVSSRDPLCGGMHCCIGGGEFDFLVTSTLASQATPAVGRALGGIWAQNLARTDPDGSIYPRFDKHFCSYVSLGDGSVNNAHFLSAINFAEYSLHRGFKCPVLFGISNNDLCISLRGYNWLGKFLEQRLGGTSVFIADSQDAEDVYVKTREAREKASRRGVPCAVVFDNISRRFGHAASDRQGAYLSEEEIETLRVRGGDALYRICEEATSRGTNVHEKLNDISSKIVDAFDTAASEPKMVDRSAVVSRVRTPLASPVTSAKIDATRNATTGKSGKGAVMRKNMTRVLDELLASNPDMVYVGEDVIHGGYYVVTEGLHAKYPNRVLDVPPDETSLVGASMGYAQSGLLPIVEIPYAAYLNCGADIFFEAATMCWLSGGKQPNGMIVRLQGFDKGVFGGNFHTHNALHIVPGLDVVCFSNGADYVRGMRYATRQARAGRMIMSVDSTALLNERHITARDDKWLRPYPTEGEEIDFDFCRVHEAGGASPSRVAIVTYGNGVLTALRAAENMDENVDVIDSPYLSSPSQGLRDELSQRGYEKVLFADVCKLGQSVLAQHASILHSEKAMRGARWGLVAAQPTYNPLGSLLTFTSEDDILAGLASIS